MTNKQMKALSVVIYNYTDYADDTISLCQY